MILCDIGNTSYHFFDADTTYKKDVEIFDPSSIKEEVFYICVNKKANKLLQKLDNWQDLSLHVDKSKYYESMGIDRIMACEAVNTGIIVDAGSALTVDVMKNARFDGGYICLGAYSAKNAYKDISEVLDYDLNFDIDLNILPKNTKDAISYGYLKPIVAQIKSYNLPIYLTGGDAKKFKKLFLDAVVDENLIFKGMKKIIDNLQN